MKKKILMSTTAIAMALAMSTGVIAAPTARDNGNVDGNSVVNSNDASVIASTRASQTEIANGNFDGTWNSINYKMSGNGNKVIDYVLTPENMTEGVALRAYKLPNSQTEGGYDIDFVANLWNDLELDSNKVAWNGTYENYDAPITAASDHTIDETISKAVSLIDAKASSQEELGKFLSGVAFEGFGKNAGKQIFLTSDEGWGVFAVAMRDIVPLSQEDLENSGYADNATNTGNDVFDGNYGVISTPYTSLSDIADSELRERAEAFQNLKSIIVTNNSHENASTNDTNIGKGYTVADAYAQFKKAFPSTVTEEQFRKTADHFGAVYTRRYTLGVNGDVIDGNGDGVNSDIVEKIIANGLYNYETATIQNVRYAFGDKIEISTTKDGQKTWGFVIELYTTYTQK